MQIGIPAEIRAGETRVAATPETVKKLAGSGHHKLLVQSGAGAGCSIPDSEFAAAGAAVAHSAAEVYGCDIVLKVRGPEPGELAMLKSGGVLIALLAPYKKEGIEAIARTGVTRKSLTGIQKASSWPMIRTPAAAASRPTSSAASRSAVAAASWSMASALPPGKLTSPL